MTDRINYVMENEAVEGQPRISAVTVGTTATALPATPLEGRNMLMVVNPDEPGAIRIYLCNEDGTGAIPLDPGDPPLRFTTRDEFPAFYAFAAAPTIIQIQEWK